MNKSLFFAVLGVAIFAALLLGMNGGIFNPNKDGGSVAQLSTPQSYCEEPEHDNIAQPDYAVSTTGNRPSVVLGANSNAQIQGDISISTNGGQISFTVTYNPPTSGAGRNPPPRRMPLGQNAQSPFSGVLITIDKGRDREENRISPELQLPGTLPNPRADLDEAACINKRASIIPHKNIPGKVHTGLANWNYALEIPGIVEHVAPSREHALGKVIRADYISRK